MRKWFFLSVFITISFQFAIAQGNYTVKGIVKDKETGEVIPYASVYTEKPQKGVSTDENGFYSITLPNDSITIFFNSFGYLSQSRKIFLNGDKEINVELDVEITEIEEVVIEIAPKKEELETTQMSTIKISSKDAKLIPAFMGEVDLIKILSLKPGVQSGGEGSSGLYVRGGGPDQNLILLDGGLVYNPNHLFGFFSVFNSDAVKDVELYKGGFPSQFGGRLSSVVEVNMNEGNKDSIAVSGGIGLISSRLTLDGPIKKGKHTFLISARRTYFDVFTRMYNKANEDNNNFNPIPDYYFQDFNTKLTFDLGKRDKLYVTGYLGRDVFGFNNKEFKFSFNWGNTLGAVRWTHYYNEKLSSNITFVATDYKYLIKNQVQDFSFRLGSKITDYNLKADYTSYYSDKHTIKYGANAVFHHFVIGRLRAGSEDNTVQFNSGRVINAGDFALYLSDDYTHNARWKFNTGLRLSSFYTIDYKKFFYGLEPRFSARYKMNEKTSLKASYARMYQYLHLVTNSGASLPTDIWYPSNPIIRPQRSDQVALGITRDIRKGKFILTDEVYYKLMKRQVDLRDGAQIFSNPNLDQEFVFGTGWSYGNELYLEKAQGKTTGWIGYTLSWTERKFDDINNGKKFYARYDRRHDVNVVAIHRLSKKINLTGTFVYGSGSWMSLPIGRMILQNINGAGTMIVPIYTERNSFRMPPYYRLDLGLVWKFKPKWGESDLTVSIYNVLNRRNPYFIYFEELKNSDDTQTVGFVAKQVSLFPIMPSLTYNFKF